MEDSIRKLGMRAFTEMLTLLIDEEDVSDSNCEQIAIQAIETVFKTDPELLENVAQELSSPDELDEFKSIIIKAILNGGVKDAENQ